MSTSFSRLPGTVTTGDEASLYQPRYAVKSFVEYETVETWWTNRDLSPHWLGLQESINIGKRSSTEWSARDLKTEKANRADVSNGAP